ncbi:hypothetical protein D3C72_632780 [compost metagenome]
MTPVYLGIDVAGASNTWICVLALGAEGPAIVIPPTKASLVDIVRLADERDVVAVAIDAQLTHAISEETGFRSGDLQLRQLLPPKCRDWVASQNSLMAVPVRGRQLADALSPVVGTIIETHPRACLYLGFPELLDPIRRYKGDAPGAYLTVLWRAWTGRFGLAQDIPPTLCDGMLDALVCATVAHLYHMQPGSLRRLRNTSTDRAGRGPFFVMA